MLTDDHIQTFYQDGVVVIENIISPEQVEAARNGLHQQLFGLGIDHEAILSGTTKFTDGIRIKSKACHIFYNKWKLDVHLNPTVYDTMMQLYNHTFFSNNPLYPCPSYICERDIGAYIDRVAWRLPDHICAEGGLSLHLDRNPFRQYPLDPGDGTAKWRPIQAFITLTDHYGSDSGGLRVVKGFHHRIDDFFSKADKSTTEEKGEFFRMHGKGYAAVEKLLQPVEAPAGSLVCWDNRLPHATADHLVSLDTREVVYTGWLPKTKLNIKYMETQLKHIEQNIAPPAYKQDGTHVDRNWDWSDLTMLQKKLLQGI